MTTIEEAAGAAAAGFIKKNGGLEDIRVIRAIRSGKGCIVEIEAYQKNPLIKSPGLPARVRDRVVYAVELDEDMAVRSYWKKDAAA